jgi:hypothetical protein
MWLKNRGLYWEFFYFSFSFAVWLVGTYGKWVLPGSDRVHQRQHTITKQIIYPSPEEK